MALLVDSLWTSGLITTERDGYGGISHEPSPGEENGTERKVNVPSEPNED